MLKDYDSLSEELEFEYRKRIDELNDYEKFLLLHDTPESDFANSYRKMLLVMLYAYFEGFCKKSFLIYIDYINQTKEPISHLQPNLAAFTMNNEFKLLNNSNHKPIRLDSEDLDDNKLQLLGRRTEFVSKYVKQMNMSVDISEGLVDTESNLKSYVLKKLMYCLALDYEKVSSQKRIINGLVDKRNAIAHGDMARAISKAEYEKYKMNILSIMNMVRNEILAGYKNKLYKNNSASILQHNEECLAVRG